jgi:serine/threonine protein kinase
VIGTTAYLAPEQLTGGPIGSATDVYALGLVLSECLTGGAAFTGTPAEIAAQRLRQPPPMPAGVGPVLGPLLAAMLGTDPASRPSAQEVAARLATSSAADTPTQVLPVGGAPLPAVSAAGRRGTNRRRRTAVALATGAAALVLLVTVGLLTLPGGHDRHLAGTPRLPPTTSSAPTSSTVPTTVPPTTAAPPSFAQVVGQMTRTIIADESAGTIKAGPANDLLDHLRTLGEHDAAGGADLAHQVSDFATMIAEHEQNGDISPSAAPALNAEVAQLRTVCC